MGGIPSVQSFPVGQGGCRREHHTCPGEWGTPPSRRNSSAECRLHPQGSRSRAASGGRAPSAPSAPTLPGFPGASRRSFGQGAGIMNGPFPRSPRRRGSIPRRQLVPITRRLTRCRAGAEPPWQGAVTRGRGRPGVSDGFPGLLSARRDPSRLRPCRGDRGAAAALPSLGSGDGTSPNAVSSRFNPVLSVSPVGRKHIPAAPGLDKLPAFYLAAAEITQLCAGRNNLRRPSSIPAFLVVPRSRCPALPLGTAFPPAARGAALLWAGWFFPTGHPFMQEVSQGSRVKCIYSIKQINSCPNSWVSTASPAPPWMKAAPGPQTRPALPCPQTN